MPNKSILLLLLLLLSVFGAISLPICHFFSFIRSPQPHFHKPYAQSKTFLSMQAVPNSAVFCSSAVLITTPSSSVHFFSFFDVLPSLMLLMYHILLISLFSSWYLPNFPISFSLTLVSRYSNINYGATSLILIHYNNIWLSCLHLLVTLDHNIPQNLYFFIFSNTFWSMFIPFSCLFRLYIPHNSQ